MKANHNADGEPVDVPIVVIKERKSKVWKQITTDEWCGGKSGLLLSKNVNQKFESKSQQPVQWYLYNKSCYQRT